MRNLVSIIVPVFNSSKFINKCVYSLVNQTYKNIEIILVNDGSTDNSGLICEELGQFYPNIIKVIHKQNGGVSSARNQGLRESNGEYISFVDSDDWIENDMIEILLNNLKNSNSDLSVCGIIEENNTKKLDIPTKQYNYNKCDKKEAFNLLLCNKSFYGYTCNKMFKRSKIGTQIFNENYSICEDLDFCLEYIMKCENICYTADKLYHYIQHVDSATGDLNFNEKKMSILFVYEKVLKIYKKERPDLLYLPQINYLKMAINLKGRLKISNKKNDEISSYLNSIINKYYKIILKNKKFSIKSKVNIIFSKNFPAFMLKLKQKVLHFINR